MTANYRDVLDRLRRLHEVGARLPRSNALGALSKASRHHLVDTALACRLLGIIADSLLGPGGSAGVRLANLFESMVAQSVRVYSQAAEARMFHFRNSSHEVDVIVERGDGSFVAIEVKVAPDVTDRDVRHLRWLRETCGEVCETRSYSGHDHPEILRAFTCSQSRRDVSAVRSHSIKA